MGEQAGPSDRMTPGCPSTIEQINLCPKTVPFIGATP